MVSHAFNDRVHSPQHYDLAREVGDSVIRRADGLFGYQLVVVVMTSIWVLMISCAP